MLLIACLIPITIYATGIVSTKTLPRYIQSQNAHHIVLGSASKRWPSKRAQLVNIQAPSIKADCSGIDIFEGAFSFIDVQAVIDMSKKIGSSALGFTFYLALETVSPQIASGIKHLSKAIQDMNALNIGSCESAAALLGAVAPRHTKLHENTCKLMAGNSGTASDFVSGRKGCAENDTKRAGINNSNADTSPLKDILQEACNVAWYVIGKNGAWTNRKMKETLMSITGTVIIQPGKPYQVLPPLVLNEDEFFDAFATGGDVKVYTCTDTKCLTMGTIDRHLTLEETHAVKVKELLSSIEDKIYTNKELDVKEVALIENTRVPILQIINVMSAYHKGKAPINIEMYADIIAHDLLTQHIRSMVGIIRQIATSVRSAQINDEPLKGYLQNLRIVEEKLRQRDAEIHKKSDQILQIIQKINLLEKSIFANMRVLASGG